MPALAACPLNPSFPRFFPRALARPLPGWKLTRHAGNLSWFASHLDALRTHAHAHRIALQLHATRDPADEASDSSSSNGTARSMTSGSSVYSTPSPLPSPRDAGEKAPRAMVVSEGGGGGGGGGLEKEDVEAVLSHLQPRRGRWEDLPCTPRRADVVALIRAAVASVRPDQKVLVAGCGPASLLAEVRNTTADCISPDGPSVALHLEQFGW